MAEHQIMDISTLWFRERPGRPHPFDPEMAPSLIIDFVVDGTWFAEALARQGLGPKAPNIDWGWNGIHSSFGTGDRQPQFDRLEALFPGKGSAVGADRAGLLFCSQCADDFCGFDSVRITESDGVISWTEYRKTWFDHFAEDDPRGGDGQWNHEPHSVEVEFHFDAGRYREALGHLRELIITMPPWPMPKEDPTYPVNQPSSTLDV